MMELKIREFAKRYENELKNKEYDLLYEVCTSYYNDNQVAYFERYDMALSEFNDYVEFDASVDFIELRIDIVDSDKCVIDTEILMLHEFQ